MYVSQTEPPPPPWGGFALSGIVRGRESGLVRLDVDVDVDVDMDVDMDMGAGGSVGQ